MTDLLRFPTELTARDQWCLCLISVIRRRQAEKRRMLPGDSLTHAPGGVESIHLRLDVQRALNGLQPDQRQVCQMLTEYSVTDVSRHLGISRPALYRMIDYLRIRFSEAG